LFSGTFEKYQNIRFIFCHGGGVIPYLVPRITEEICEMRERGESVPHLRDALARQYYDLTSTISHANVALLRKIVPFDHLLFGTDYPFAQGSSIKAALDRLDKLGLPPEEEGQIEERNIKKLLQL
jgi:predicted TIM-barrel fold metal-dependent hydrolase